MDRASDEQPTATKQPKATAQPTVESTAAEEPKPLEQKSSMNLSAFDSLLKYIAAFSLLLYCCGYLVTSVSSLNWGFYQVAPFRPKVASAGVWFILFLGVPIAATVLRSRREELADRTNTNLPESFHFYAIWGLGLGYGTISLFEMPTPLSMHALFIPFLIVGGYIIIGFISGKGRIAVTIKWVVSAASIFLVAGSGFYDLIKYRLVSVSAVFLWYVVVGFVFNFAFNRMFKGRTTLENLARGVPYVVSVLLLALSCFGRSYYPHIKASWGGGAPVSVTILFAKESPILPGQYLSTQLLDESDIGLYIVGKNETRASFIPRNQIALITYSDSPSEGFQSKPK